MFKQLKTLYETILSPTIINGALIISSIFLFSLFIYSSPIVANENSPHGIYDLSLEDLMKVEITSHKRKQHWYEIASSVDIYDGRLLGENNIHQLQELSQVASGLLYSHIGNSPNIYIRGIGSDLLSIAADASTAVYYDDVYLARPQMAMAQFWDIERIEILKGPQGALYGRNATSGAIKIVNAQAKFDKKSAYVNLNGGTFSTRQLEAAINVPWSDSFAIRTSVFTVKNNGFTQDLDDRNGRTLDDLGIAASRVNLRWKINENIETSLTAEYYENNNHGYSLKPIDNKGLAESLGAIPVNDFHATRNDLSSYNDYKRESINWRWLWATPGFEITSITSYKDLKTEYLQNTDGTEIPVTVSQLAWDASQISQEIKLVSTESTNWKWLIGGSWFKETPKNNLSLVREPINTSINIFAYAKTTAWSMFGELEWSFKPQWNVKLALRDSYESRKDGNDLYSTHDLLGLDSSLSIATSIGKSRHDESFQKLSPQMVLSYKPDTNNGNSLWYFSITEGFKSGGSNSFSTATSFKPEEILSYETGFKQTNKMISWQLSAFNYDYKNLQVLSFENGTTSINNAANATIQGIDANMQWEFNPQWFWQAGVTFLDAHYDEFLTSLAGKAKDVSGNIMPYAPQWDFSQTLHYKKAFNVGKLHFTLQHQYQSRTYFNQFKDRAISEGRKHYVNLQSLLRLNPQWDIGVRVENLFDKEYYQVKSRFTSTSLPSAPEGNALGVAASGRKVLAMVNYRF